MEGDTQPSDGPNLDPDNSDRVALLGRIAAGFVPLAGSLLGEAITTLIPNQRLDRVAQFCQSLHRRLQDLEKSAFEKRLRDPQVLDLLESSLHIVVRSLSADRIDQVASVMENGFRSDELAYERLRTVLRLLEELSDAEVVRLASFTREKQDDQAWFQKHESLLDQPLASIGSPQEEVDRYVIFTQMSAHLVRLGLLKPRFKKPAKGVLPEMDPDTGAMKARGHNVTRLGCILLEATGVLSSGSAEQTD